LPRHRRICRVPRALAARSARRAEGGGRLVIRQSFTRFTGLPDTRRIVACAFAVWGDFPQHRPMTGLVDELWVFAAVAAAGFQTLRFMLQKVLATVTLSPAGATFARFVYSAPIIFLLLVIYVHVLDRPLSLPDRAFWTFAVVGGLAQVLATVCVVTLFKARNFAVGVTLMKTEVIFSLVVGLILLGDPVSLAACLSIVLGLFGVLLLSAPPEVRGLGRGAMWNRGAVLGLTSGVLFAVSAVCYRGASLHILSGDPVLRAGVTLSAVTALQMVGMSIWFALRDAQQLVAVWRARRVAIWIGLLSLAGSFCWFLAFTLQNAAYVKVIGQIELIFSVLASVLFFSERISRREYAGIALLCMSILALLLSVRTM
jgi:drug/metabolite transporter (DMT)-like permease